MLSIPVSPESLAIRSSSIPNVGVEYRGAQALVDLAESASFGRSSCNKALVAVGLLAAAARRRGRPHAQSGLRQHGVVARRAVAVSEAPVTKTQQRRKRPKVIVLGSGWGAASFIEGMSEEEAQMYDITLVSPRNHFLYTPLLPTCAMGSIEERSIVTPMRRIVAGKADFVEAKCESIDTIRQVITCGRAGNPSKRNAMDYDRFPDESVEGKLSFDMEYDILVYSVGAEANDFNCPGVKEHAFLFKEVEDARRVRNKISDLFEKAALPSTTPEDRDGLLTFVVVGGGPTGVEVAADLCDFIREDVGLLYPKLTKHVSVKLINTGDHLLSTYDRDISDASLAVFEKQGLEVMKGVRVAAVKPDTVEIKVKSTGETVPLPYGCVVWCTGIKQNSLTVQLKESLLKKNEGRKDLDTAAAQANTRAVVADLNLKVRGSLGSIFALGDACTVENERAKLRAEELFREGDADGSGKLDVEEMKTLFKKASDDFPQFSCYATYFDEGGSQDEPDDVKIAINRVFTKAADVRGTLTSLTQQSVTDRRNKLSFEEVEQTLKLDANNELNYEEFVELLNGIDNNMRSFPATAQVAAQQGKYLARLFATGKIDGKREGCEEAAKEIGSFTYFHKGSLAYLGNGEAAFDVPIIGAVTGPLAGLAWKAYETSAQLTWKNRILVALDWLRTGIFGRDTSRF